MKHPPYHLRANKAVDRLLLVEVLQALGSSTNYREFTYHSLAGPFLEDMRVMEHFFPDMPLVSLESSLHTYRRQEFHRFNSRIELRRRSMSDYILHDYEPGNRSIFWLDYTDLKFQYFGDFQATLKKVPSGSVVRITLRAEPPLDTDALKDRVSEDELNRVLRELQKTFENEFQQVLPHPTPQVFAGIKEFAKTVQLMVRRAASTALDTAGSERDFIPVQSTRYNDGTQMVSITGIICLRTEIDAVRAKLQSVRFANFDWSEPTEINIPALSIKERLLLERHLPVQNGQDAGDVLYDQLGYNIHDSAKASKQQLAHYADYCRDYPNFVRISV